MTEQRQGPPERRTNQIRLNAGKPQLAALVPLGALEGIARASEVGLVKYSRDSFREKGGYSVVNCLNSAVRHIFMRTGGEKYDQDASKRLGKPVDHLDMAIWNLAAALEGLRLYGEDNDDTWVGPTGDRGVANMLAELTRLAEEMKKAEAPAQPATPST